MVADETFKLRLEGNSVTSASLAKVAPIYVRMDFLRSTATAQAEVERNRTSPQVGTPRWHACSGSSARVGDELAFLGLEDRALAGGNS